MVFSRLQYLPLALPHFSVLALIFLFLVAWIEVWAVRSAYVSMGLGRHAALLLLLASLGGSYFNIPVAQLPADHIVSDQVVSFYGMHYIIPEVINERGTVIAVNVGGALIPGLLSIYMYIKNRLWITGILGTVVVAAVCHWFATPVRGLGIALPAFVAPLTTAAVALVLSTLLLSRHHAGPLAYISGSLGTLIGADLLNLGKVQGLGAPIASIGGAGTFDGVFLAGILGVLLASIFAPSDSPDSYAPSGRPDSQAPSHRPDSHVPSDRPDSHVPSHGLDSHAGVHEKQTHP
jgi:uncharacterized membrane protein